MMIMIGIEVQNCKAYFNICYYSCYKKNEITNRVKWWYWLSLWLLLWSSNYRLVSSS